MFKIEQFDTLNSKLFNNLKRCEFEILPLEIFIFKYRYVLCFKDLNIKLMLCISRILKTNACCNFETLSNFESHRIRPVYSKDY